MKNEDLIMRCPNCGVKIDPRDHLNPGPCCTILCPLCNHKLISDNENKTPI